MCEGCNEAFLSTVVARLGQAYPREDLGNLADPLDELVFIVLSSCTRGPVFRQTFAELRRAFPTWDSVLLAPPEAVENHLKRGGLQAKKGAWLRQTLAELKRSQNRVSLDFLKDLDNARAEDYLTTLPGVGIKSARCVMMYSLGREVLPVDANVFRLSRRLGCIPASIDYRRSHQLIQDIVPPRLRHDFHVLSVVHGRRRCKPRKPSCSECCLVDLCRTGQETVALRT